MKIRSHNSKSNQFLRHSKGIFTSSIIEFGPVVWLDQVHKVWETTDNLRDLSDLDIQDGCLKLKVSYNIPSRVAIPNWKLLS